ncbi:multidrug resistance ABC transporter ATP-binding/permease protein BmrA [Sporosarcina sp. NCCP-2716]|uniref:ABC transporter ATP-binding protein n=1 Tax=Sporosarcina sp. NCCP-2716 TaxID=2943679 RepID=UPI0020410D7D|nr:ABC transporter ATP-binding protein [Sporosarcina sp. NCCP-2716]GKV68196.1 multidrug resistance ABC transporter ATP-binding/permease protein BmrA [Sporosarcina sp. NCCP-2716]
MNDRKRKSSWGEFFHLIRTARLPWLLYFLQIITALSTTTLVLSLPLVLQQIVEGNIFDKEIIWRYVYLSLGSAGLLTVSTFFIYITSPITKRNIQRVIWPKLIRLPMKNYRDNKSLNMISRVTLDPSYIDRAIGDFTSLTNTTYSLVGSFVIMYGMNVKLTLALLPVIPYIIIVSIAVGHFTQKTQHGVQNRLSDMTAFFAERLPKIRLIKTFGKENYESEKSGTVIQNQYKADKRRATVDLFAEPLMQSVQAIVVGTVLVYGGYLVSKGEMKVSQVLSFYLYVQFIHNNVLQYGLFWQTLKQAKGASAEIAKIQEAGEEQLMRTFAFSEKAQQPDADLTLENVSFSYGDRLALENVNLTIPKGKTTAIVGPSGGGKSTIFGLLERLYEPNVGRVLIGSTPAENVHLDEWRAGIAYVSQNAPLLSGTIRENILYGVREDVGDDIVWLAAKHAAADEFIREFPEGLDKDVGEFGSKLSGGQRQRVAIARAFIMDPDYLLLDEAMASLDAQSEHDINRALRLLMKGRTTALISHNLRTMKQMDHIILVNGGQVEASGTHAELMRSSDLYKDLITIQDEKEQLLSTV